MRSDPAQLLEYQPQHRHAQEKKVWRSVAFYALGALGLVVVLGAFGIVASFIGDALGFW